MKSKRQPEVKTPLRCDNCGGRIAVSAPEDDKCTCSIWDRGKVRNGTTES